MSDMNENKNILESALNKTSKIENKIYNKMKKKNPNSFLDLIKKNYEWEYANKFRKYKKVGESSLNATLADMIYSELALDLVKSTSKTNKYVKLLMDAYKQNPYIHEYFIAKDIFYKSYKYNKELNRLVELLFDGEECFEEAVVMALDYVQMTCMYAFTDNLVNGVLRYKDLTPFERKLFSEKDEKYKDEAINALLFLGQSQYIAMFGGRTVCGAMAEFTASILDYYYDKYKIDGISYIECTDTHAFVVVKYDSKKYIIDPTNFFTTFDRIYQNDLQNSQYVKNAKFIEYEKFYKKAHNKVMKILIKEYDIEKLLSSYMKKNDDVKEKINGIILCMRDNLSSLSTMLSKKGLYINNREIEINNFFELSLKSCGIKYKTDVHTNVFEIMGKEKILTVDTSKIFDNHNSIKKTKAYISKESVDEK